MLPLAMSRPCPQIFLNLSAAHYPERLGTFFIVSAPTVFNTLWRAISHFIDPVTKQKVRRARKPHRPAFSTGRAPACGHFQPC